MDETAATLVGSVIADRYLVSKLLGEGGMGQVYLAGHVRLPQQAAIKVLRSSMVQDAAAIARFNREAANAARIEHERVARVFDFGETSNGLVYLAMEFVPGRTLTEVLQEAGRLSPERAANIVYQVADGLEAAHRISIVHRDLKPDNILVVSDESGADKCKVVDFGIAKAFDDSESRKTQLTQAGAIIGTPEFMSPEQVLGEHLDARSDVYALAVVAYHLLTGSLPFVAATPERSLTMRLIQDPSPLSEAVPDVHWPPALQEALDRALAREPEQRTPSALQFAEELIAAIEGWTGAVVLRGRTPSSSASISAARSAATSGMQTAVNAFRSAPTVEIENRAATNGFGGSSASVASSAASGVSSAPAAGSPEVNRSRLPLLAGTLVLAALVVGGGLYATRNGEAGATPESTAEQSASGVPPAPGTSPDNSAGDATAENAGSGAPAADADARTQRRVVSETVSEQGGPLPVSDPPSGNAAIDAAGAAEPAGVNASRAASTPPGAERAALEREFSAIQARLLAAPELATVARQEIPRLQALLPRYTTAADSVWVYVALVYPYASLEDDLRMCSALLTANRLATSPKQIEAVRQLKSEFTNCL